MKPALLFLSHRIPFPPNKGDKIRSFHLLRHLSSNYRVFMGGFIDEEDDWDYISNLDEWCEETFFLGLNPKIGKLRSITGLFTRQALTIPYYTNARMGRWIDSILSRESIDTALVYSSAMAQYVINKEFGNTKLIIDFVDVDSDKWRQYSENKSWPMNWIYRREADRLLQFEREAADHLDHSFFVSSKEAELFKRLAPETAHKVSFFNNGVDVDIFSPDYQFPSPFPADGQTIVFTGAMDYWPNADAVIWFANEVLPIIRTSWPEARFFVVGSNPTDQVKLLGTHDGIVVTGKVDDVRPYISKADVVIAPMRIARGIQNKVLEGMAMARPVVVTSMGLEGIEASDRAEVLVADNSYDFARCIDDVLHGKFPNLGRAAREMVCREFTWGQSLPKVNKQIEMIYANARDRRDI